MKTSINNGEIIILHHKFHNREIPECLTIAKNGQALTTILNNTQNNVTLDISEPLTVEKFDRKHVQEIELNNFDDVS